MALFSISEVYTEYAKNPMGQDCRNPRFSWKISSAENNFIQSTYRIQAGTLPGEGDAWDTGIIAGSESNGIRYEGAELIPCTRYYLTVTVTDTNGNTAVNDENWFETGLMDPSQEAWEGAEWIGAPEKYLSADTMGVFVLESDITLAPGSRRAGIVFGADDPRLMDERKNQYEIAGENYIRYEINAQTLPARLDIYRVGYAKDDSAEVPFASRILAPFSEENCKDADYIPPETDWLLNEKNLYEPHHIRIECIGNNAFFDMDGVRVDAVMTETFHGPEISARQLNPLGFNDVNTFPRLNSIGYFVGEGDEAHFSGIKISNVRTPGAEVMTLDPDGVTVKGMDEDGDPAERQMVIDPSCHSMPMLRRKFEVDTDKKPAKARLYITARGIYDCRINGEKVTETLLNPGHTQYDKHILYQTYDVLPQLKSGANGIGITLASGWWCDAQTFVVKNYNYYGDKEAVLAKLVITYEDGSRETIVTEPESWDYYGEGPYTFAGLFNGEHLDGRRIDEFLDFSKPDFIIPGQTKRPVIITPSEIEESNMAPGFASPWPKLKYDHVQIVGGVQAPVVKVTEVPAKTMNQPREGLFLYDLEQEIAGVPQIRLKGKAGTLVTIRYGEMLYPELPEYGNLHGMMLTENYRDAESIDKYILRGDEEGEIYTPYFTFHGFRYIEISGLEEAPAICDVKGIQISSVREITGQLETSEPLLNRFIENVCWSQLCNFISIPTDCPQRNERMGWAGDTHVFARCATYQSDTHMFYYRYLEALRDLQEETGKMPDVAPAGGGFGGITYESAMILIAWELYQQFGDTGVIEEYYGTMKKWMAYIHGKGMPGPSFVGPLGDWLAPEETDLFLIFNAFYGHDADLMSRMAAAIGKAEDAKWYRAQYEETKDFWNRTFVDPASGKTRGLDGKENNTQCAYALGLAYHMFSDENKPKAYEHLAEKTLEVGCTVSTGFFGTGVLNPMLTEGGHTDLAYRLLLSKEFPGWLYPVTQGATTIWERWNSYTVENGFGGNNSMNSFNHYSLGSVLTWIYETVLGIQRDEEMPGYRHFTLKPAMMILDYAKGGFETAYGRISSAWEKTGNGYRYSCTIPANTTADVVLPDGLHKLGSGSYTFDV